MAEFIWKDLSKRLDVEVNSYGLVTLQRPYRTRTMFGCVEGEDKISAYISGKTKV